MKRLIFIGLLISLLFCSTMVAAADEPVISGKTYTWTFYTVIFTQGPFGPGECGTVEIICGTETIIVPYTYSPPILDLGGLQFVLVGNALYYIDPAGIVLTEK